MLRSKAVSTRRKSKILDVTEKSMGKKRMDRTMVRLFTLLGIVSICA
jgi:hypothetical protein